MYIKASLLNFIFLIFLINIKAQNLFLNPGFEEYINCPDSYSGINKGECTDWKCIAGSPDYYNCSFYGSPGGDIYGVPSSGKGVVGMWGLINNIFCEGQLQRESIAAGLVEPLIPCEEYRVTFDIRLDKTGSAAIPGFGHDCLDFGFYFYKGSDPNVCYNSCGCWNVEPQIAVSSGFIPKDAYITFSLDFTAANNYDKVAIGPFCNALMSMQECLAPLDNFGPFLLYFNLDNIRLEHIENDQPILDADTILCSGDTLTLDATMSNATGYLWQDSSTQSTLRVFQSGLYIVQIKTDCKTFEDSILVSFELVPELNLGADTAICTGDTLTLFAQGSNTTYQWQNQSENPWFHVLSAGDYWVEISNECSSVSDTITISELNLPTIDLGPSVSLCDDDIIILDASSPSSVYRWQDDSTDPRYEIAQPGIYWVAVTNSCGQATDTLSVDMSACGCHVYIPNVFTPNLDNVNDRFVPVFFCDVEVYSLKIFDRWGEMVYYTEDFDEYWNGEYYGKACQSGVYTYLLTYSTTAKDSFFQYGDIALIR